MRHQTANLFLTLHKLTETEILVLYSIKIKKKTSMTGETDQLSGCTFSRDIIHKFAKVDNWSLHVSITFLTE